MLIYSYINTSRNWKNEKLCGNTTAEGRSVFTQFRVFPISTSVDITVYQYGKNVLDLFYNIAQRNIKKEIFRRFRVDIELYQHGSQPISVQNLQMLYYKYIYHRSTDVTVQYPSFLHHSSQLFLQLPIDQQYSPLVQK